MPTVDLILLPPLAWSTVWGFAEFKLHYKVAEAQRRKLRLREVWGLFQGHRDPSSHEDKFASCSKFIDKNLLSAHSVPGTYLSSLDLTLKPLRKISEPISQKWKLRPREVM